VDIVVRAGISLAHDTVQGEQTDYSKNNHNGSNPDYLGFSNF